MVDIVANDSAVLMYKRSMVFSQTQSSPIVECAQSAFLLACHYLHRLPAVAMALVWSRFDHPHTTLCITRDCLILFCSTYIQNLDSDSRTSLCIRCWAELCGSTMPEGSWQDSWRALEQLVASGQLASIGVRNFDLSTLVQQYARLTGMQYQGYSTLGSQWLMKGYHSNPVLTHPAVIRAAHGIHRSPAQVVLRWALQHGQAVIPRSANPGRIWDNIALDFELSAAAVRSIDEMAQVSITDATILRNL
ncbi:TPA: hypothetical protein ACH3X2_007948 [Trebouxia sp. C0005]